MGSPIIRINNLGKRYWISHQGRPRYRALRDEMVEWVARPFRALGRALAGRPAAADVGAEQEEFWALRGVSFDVHQGDVVGIIGPNGAGKSTLLKILSRITEPTEGRVEIEGRVASLLEVGTGFHPELTGRENIFLNGAILGMSRAEIRKKFDEIVAFAEVERFLDTPVKRFSSGMYVRLAFAVAAHLEPEILVIDEVLAVGDAQFQKKCLGKMHDVSTKEGRTVLFVSHQMGTVRQLCTRGVLLKNGQIDHLGPTAQAIERYMDLGKANSYSANLSAQANDVSVKHAGTYNTAGELVPYFLHDEAVTIRTQCLIKAWIPGAELRLYLADSRGRLLFTADVELTRPNSIPGLILAEARIPPNMLRPATYSVTFWTFVHNQYVIQKVQDALSFEVRDGGSKYAASEGLDYGCIFSPCEWSVAACDAETNSHLAPVLGTEATRASPTDKSNGRAPSKL